MLQLPSNSIPGRISLNTELAAGSRTTLAELEGAGCINHIWLCPGREPRAGRNLIIRIYFDSEPIPNVEAPLGDFFGVMHGITYYPLNTEFLSILEESGYNCYFKMPFKSKARIELEAGGEDSTIFLMVDWHRYPDGEMQESKRFCARWRHETPTISYGHDYLVLDADGPGQLIGFVYGVKLIDNEDRWSHGGSDNIYIDGEGAYPAYLRGIGGEDTFGTSYGGALHHPETMLYTGIPYYTHEDTGEARPAQRLVGYRFYAKDSITFQESLQIRFGCMKNDICSTVYWYAEKSVRQYCTIPSAENLSTGERDSSVDLPLPSSGSWHLFGPLPADYVFNLEEIIQRLLQQKVPEIPVPYSFGINGNNMAILVQKEAVHGFIDFRHHFRVRKRGVSPTESATAIALCEIESRKAENINMNIAWDDKLTVYHNGQVYDMGTKSMFAHSSMVLPLAAGKNLLGLILTNTTGLNHGGWSFAASFKTADGHAIYPKALSFEERKEE